MEQLNLRERKEKATCRLEDCQFYPKPPFTRVYTIQYSSIPGETRVYVLTIFFTVYLYPHIFILVNLCLVFNIFTNIQTCIFIVVIVLTLLQIDIRGFDSIVCIYTSIHYTDIRVLISIVCIYTLSLIHI